LNEVEESFADLFGATPAQTSRIEDLARQYVAAQKERALADAAAKAAKSREDALKVVLIGAFQQSGTSGLKLDGGPSISTVKKVHFSMPARGDEERYAQALAWLRSHGQGEIIRWDVNGMTLGATLRELNGDGIEIPELFNRFEETSVSVRK
jgi:hypothetical protein